LILLVAHGCSRDLGGHAGFLQPGIGGHEADFVHTNASGIGNRGFQLFGKFGRLCFSGGKGVDKSGEFRFGHLLGELHAGQPGRGKQLRKLFLGRRPFKRHPIEQQLRPRRPQQQPGLCPFGNRRSELIPGD
jgi:hypothetical protein